MSLVGPPLSLNAWLRYDVIRRLLPPGKHRLLEVGAGVGSVGALLAERFDYVGVEPDPISYAAAARRVGTRGRTLNCTVDQLPDEEMFDIVCAFEVLEHIEDDGTALTEWLRHLRPGGWTIVSVPHGRGRFGPQDERVGHYRRYDRSDLEAVLARTGLLEITVVSYGFPLANALDGVRNALARRGAAPSAVEERTGTSGRWLQPPEWAGLATRAFTFPFRLLQRPFAETSLGPGLVARGRLRGPREERAVASDAAVLAAQS